MPKITHIILNIECMIYHSGDVTISISLIDQLSHLEGSTPMYRIGLLITSVLLLCLATFCGLAGNPSYTAHVWEDSDGDGKLGKDEKPMAGIVVQIVDPSNGILWMRPVTDSDGNTFPFSAGGSCGQYDIYLSVPDGYWPTTPIVVNTPNCETAQFGLKPYP